MRLESILLVTFLVGGVATLPGCGDASTKHQPTASSAREALEASLSAWKKGETPDSLISRTPSIQAVDTHWRQGKRLENYEIKKEEAGEGDQRFSVLLSEVALETKTKPAAYEVTYIVIGRDPVMVYRDEDYTRFVNMEDNPSLSRKGARKK